MKHGNLERDEKYRSQLGEAILHLPKTPGSSHKADFGLLGNPKIKVQQTKSLWYPQLPSTGRIVFKNWHFAVRISFHLAEFASAESAEGMTPLATTFKNTTSFLLRLILNTHSGFLNRAYLL